MIVISIINKIISFLLLFTFYFYLPITDTTNYNYYQKI